VTTYGERFPQAKIKDIQAHSEQILGSTSRSVQSASYAATAVAVVVAALVTLLFIKMLIAKDRYAISVMKAVGFTCRDISAQFVARSIFVLLLGAIVGTLMANTLGQALAGMIIGSLGAASFQFVINPLYAYLICPAAMACVVFLATLAGLSGIKQMKISDNIKE
jgi:putative ABC transport system permease protein